LILPVEEFDEFDDGRNDYFLRLGAARVPLLRDDVGGRHFAYLPVGFNPAKQTVQIIETPSQVPQS